MPTEPKTQKQSTELILYRLDELTRTTTERFDKIDNKMEHSIGRDEIMLMRNDTLKDISSLKAAQELHAKMLSALKEKDDLQQGAIDAKKSMNASNIAIVAVIASIVSGFAEALLWLQGLHKW